MGRCMYFGKTWIYWAQLLVLGPMSFTCIVSAVAVLTGHLETLSGQDAVAVTAMSVGGTLLLIPVATASFNVIARRQPLLELFDHHLLIRIVGGTSLDGAWWVPGWLRFAWGVASGQAFRTQNLTVPFERLLDVKEVGSPMARHLVIQFEAVAERGELVSMMVSLPQHELKVPPRIIAMHLRDFCYGSQVVRRS